jgi:hypothetical protein
LAFVEVSEDDHVLAFVDEFVDEAAHLGGLAAAFRPAAA